MLVVSDFIGCTDTAYKDVRVDSLTEIHISFNDSSICAGEKVTIGASYADTGSTGINWDFGDGIITTTGGHDIDHAYEQAGIYNIHVIATGRVCPDVDSTLLLTVLPQPIINIGPDTSICPTSGPLVLQDLVNGGNAAASWKWMQGVYPMEEKSFNIAVTAPATYAAIVTIDGCSATDSVDVLNDCYIDAPNAFTPDGDNSNDYFLPRQLLSKGVVKFKMQIFNRWGQELYTTTQIGGRGWDGKLNDVLQPQGVYVYMIEVTMRDGIQEKKQGNVTLLR
jgi:gliding motility-associated-like protein